MKIQLLSMLLVLYFLVPTTSFAKDTIAVWNLESPDVPVSYIKTLTSVFLSEILKSKKFEVYSENDISNVAGWQGDKKIIGCTRAECLRALARMDIAKLISGRVGKIGNTYSLSLSLYDNRTAKLENSVSDECSSDDELILIARKAVRNLLGEQTGLVIQKGVQTEDKKQKVSEEMKRLPTKRVRAYEERLGMQITELKFFESGKEMHNVIEDKKNWKPSNEFSKKQTKYIYVWLWFLRPNPLPPPATEMNFQMEVVIYDPAKKVCDQAARGHFTGTDIGGGSFWEKVDCGEWQIGTYEAEVYFDGSIVASDSFSQLKALLWVSRLHY